MHFNILIHKQQESGTKNSSSQILRSSIVFLCTASLKQTHRKCIKCINLLLHCNLIFLLCVFNDSLYLCLYSTVDYRCSIYSRTYSLFLSLTFCLNSFTYLVVEVNLSCPNCCLNCLLFLFFVLSSYS